MSTCQEKLIDYFLENHIPFETKKHRHAYTAQEIAAEQKVPGKQMAKVVMIQAEGNLAMLVMPASYRIHFGKLANVIGCQDVRLAEEKDFAGLFPDCATGAMPPFGNLYHIPVYVDKSLTQDQEIVFNAGTHDDTMQVRYEDYARLAQPIVADFGIHQ